MGNGLQVSGDVDGVVEGVSDVDFGRADVLLDVAGDVVEAQLRKLRADAFPQGVV